jgi:hypothetical protein
LRQHAPPARRTDFNLSWHVAPSSDKVAARFKGAAMTIEFGRLGPAAISLLLAGCVAVEPAQPPAPPPVAPVRRPLVVQGLETVMGRTAGMLASQFGKADLDVREGTARKLQFIGPACILDAYLYPPAAGGEAIVTHIDARLPDGRDMDLASCVAALSRREEAR